MPDQKSKLEVLCAEKGLKMTDQRRVIARVLSESSDHPDVEALHKRATAVDHTSHRHGLPHGAAVQEAGILAKHDFGRRPARYEETPEETRPSDRHPSGKVVEFHNDEIEDLQRRIAEEGRIPARWAPFWSSMACLWTANPTGKNEWTRPNRLDKWANDRGGSLADEAWH